MPENSNTIIEDALYLMANGGYEKVHTDAISMIHADVNNPLPYFLLAKLCFDHKNYAKAQELFEKSLTLDPDNLYARVYFAQMLTQTGNHEGARDMLELAAALNTSSAHLADTVGVVYSRIGHHDRAIDWFEKAVSLDPKPANYHYNLAASLQFLGEFDRAGVCYENTLARTPNAYRALSALASLKKQTRANNKIDILHRCFQTMHEDADAKLYLGHALAKTYEDLGEYETSFSWLEKAKADKCQLSPTFDYSATFAAAKQTIDLLPNNTPKLTVSKRTPIFVVGLPRTGTTLVDRIISSHPDVVSCGELNTFANLIKQTTQTRSNLVLDAETLDATKRINLTQVGEQYLRSTQALCGEQPFSIDKMPLNFFYVAVILKALPNARVIVLRRGAMDSCLSNYRQLLTTEHNYYDYTYSLTSTAKFYSAFDNLMCHWQDNLPPERFMQIQYEDIVHDQQNQTQKLLNFCQLDWDEVCMRFHENTAPVSTASSVQVRQPLYANSIGRWRRYGTLLNDLSHDLNGL